MNVSFYGYHADLLTFEATSSVTAGLPVVMSDNGKVTKATTDFFGVCASVKNGFASVQIDGYVRLPYTGSLSVGYNKLIVNSDAVKVDASNGRERLVLDVDETTHTAGIIL